MRRSIQTFCLTAAVLAMAGTAGATLTPIGTATYGGAQYSLIWDDDNNGNSIVWLDYSAPQAYWEDQLDWAAGLDAQLTYNLDPAYTVTWNDSAWRLPDAGAAPSYGCLDTTTQEMAHLYYQELGLTGGSSNDGVTPPDLSGCVFDNLTLSPYWTRTEEDPLFSTEPVWMFAFRTTRSAPYYDTVFGFQDIDATAGSFWGIPLAMKHYGIAVRGADVQGGQPPIPEPVTMAGLMLGVGGLLGYVRRRRR